MCALWTSPCYYLRYANNDTCAAPARGFEKSMPYIQGCFGDGESLRRICRPCWRAWLWDYAACFHQASVLRGPKKKKKKADDSKLALGLWAFLYTMHSRRHSYTLCVWLCNSYIMRWTNKQDRTDAGRVWECVSEQSGLTLYLHGGDVSMGHIAVDIFDLWDVLLGHLDEFGARRLVRELRWALLLWRAVLIVVFVFLWRKQKERTWGSGLSTRHLP